MADNLCMHCGLGRINGRRLKPLLSGTIELTAIVKLFDLRVQSAFLCTNCAKVVLNLFNKFNAVREKCTVFVHKISLGTLSPSRIPVRNRNVEISTQLKYSGVKRPAESPAKSCCNTPESRRTIDSPVMRQADKKTKRILFASGTHRFANTFVIIN